MMLIHQVSRPQTAFQQPVDESELRSCLQRQLPDEPILAVSELDAGLFNNTFRVDTADRAYILKVAPAADAAVFYNERRLMQRERRISEHLRSASSLVPEYLSFFSVDGRQALLQPFVDGRLWGEEIARLSESENCLLWQQLGEFAATVHACRGTGFGYPGHEFTRWSRVIVDNVEGMVEDCRQQAVLGAEIEQYLALLPHFLPALDRIETPALLHGDLWPSNVIFDGTGADIHLEAVIDGERAFWGDPVCDWARSCDPSSHFLQHVLHGEP